MSKSNSKRIERECFICGKLKRTEKVLDGKSICPSCYQKNYAPKRICFICNQEKITTKNLDNKSICPSCYKQYYLPKETCSVCGKFKYVTRRIGEKAICRSCNRKLYVPKHLCSICGKEHISEKKIDGMNICQACYIKNYAPKKVCSICNNTDIVTKIINGDNICPACYRKFFRVKKICAVCNNESYVGKVINDAPICGPCYNKHYRTTKSCSICNKEDIVQKIVEDKPICPRCYRKHYIPKKLCFICKKENVINKIVEGNSICPSCYQRHYRTKRMCSICGGEGFISKTSEGLDICISCYKKNYIPKKICSICNKENIVTKRDDGKNICPSCYFKYYRPSGLCSICGENKIVSKSKDGLNVCTACYNKHYRPVRTCMICGNLKPTNKIVNEESICPSCYKKYYKKYLCSSCGEEIRHYRLINGMRFCNNCYFNANTYHLEQIQLLIRQCKSSFSSIDVYNLLLRFSEHLILYRKAFTAFSIIINQYGIFEYIDKSDTPLQNLDYKYFENIKNKLSLSLSLALENFLIKDGILKPQTSLELFIDHFNSLQHKLTDEYTDVFNRYSDYLISRKKKFIQRGYEQKFSIITFKQYIRLSLLFLEFLQKYGISINEINNEHITDFLVSNCSDYIHKQLKYFVNWINHNEKLFRKLSVPKFVRSDKREAYSSEDLTIIVNVLNAPSTSKRDRAICYLALLYTLRPFELCKIKLSDCVVAEGRAKLFVRDTWIFLNPFVSKIISEYIANERNPNLSLGSNTDWLFFGYHYNKPLSETRIYAIFHKYNLLSTKSFTTAISNLILEGGWGPSILIKGLGIKNSTACDYYKMLGINSTFYLGSSDTDKLPLSYDNGYYIYILKCSDGSYYTGYTLNLNNRVQQHQNGTGSTYTKTRTPIELVYHEELPDKSTALKREKQIKTLTIFEKEKLIEKSRMNQ